MEVVLIGCLTCMTLAVLTALLVSCGFNCAGSSFNPQCAVNFPICTSGLLTSSA